MAPPSPAPLGRPGPHLNPACCAGAFVGCCNDTSTCGIHCPLQASPRSREAACQRPAGCLSLLRCCPRPQAPQVAGYPTSVAALAFNGAATQLAVAASYTYEQGEREHPADAIFVRDVGEGEVRPKQRQPAPA